MLVAYRVAKFRYSKQTSFMYSDIDTVNLKASTFPFDWLTGQTQMPALKCGLPSLTLAPAQAVFQYVLESVRQQQASVSHSFPLGAHSCQASATRCNVSHQAERLRQEA